MAILAAGLLFLCLIYRLSLGNRFVDHIPFEQNGNGSGNVSFIPENEGVLHAEKIEVHERYIEVHLVPDGPGSSEAGFAGEDGSETRTQYEVGPLKTVWNRETGNFTGDTAFLCTAASFFLIAAFLLFRFFLRIKGHAFYSYATIYSAGFSLFAFDIGILLLIALIDHVTDPVRYPMFAVYSTIRIMSFHFMFVTAPFLLVFAVSMCISNIELLRHEGRRFRNFLGILISLAIVVGEVIGFRLNMREMSGSAANSLLQDTVQSVYSTAFVYFECMLIGAIICGIRAALHKAAPDKDYCIILGCSFRKDGSLTPLLQGRVDRAVEFDKWQNRQNGKELTFIPSGGQGPDESMPEAEAMRKYLISRGIPDSRILPEDQSRNTYQNMAFSKKLIEERDPRANVIFSTTNYHVFRSGVWAGLAGLQAEGIGSRTKWWYWPNAFMRECVGLLQNRWKQELAALILLIGFCVSISLVMGI